MSAAVSGFEAKSCPWRDVDRAEWDAFADLSDATFQATSGMIKRSALLGQVQALILHDGAKRIAQAAVRIGKGSNQFLDAAAILPDYRSSWTAVLNTLLQQLPRGKYHYGSTWHEDVPRDQDIGSLQGVSNVQVSPYMLDTIRLGAFTDFGAYEAALSRHHRRHLKSCEKLGDKVSIDARTGRAGLGLVPKVTRLRGETYSAKSLGFSSLRSGAGLAAKIIQLGASARTSIISKDGEAMGAYFGAATARSGFYIHGGNRRSNDGLAHRLMLHHIQETFAMGGKRFVMGFAAGHDEEGVEVEGHRRFRFGFLAEPMRGSTVTFVWHGSSLQN